MSGCTEKSSIDIPSFEEWWVHQSGGLGTYECRGYNSGNQCPDEWVDEGVFSSIGAVEQYIIDNNGGQGCVSVDVRDSTCCESEVIKPITVCRGKVGTFIGCGDESMIIGFVQSIDGSAVQATLAYYIFSFITSFIASYGGDCSTSNRLTCQVTENNPAILAGTISSDSCQGVGEYCDLGCSRVSHNPTYGYCSRSLVQASGTNSTKRIIPVVADHEAVVDPGVPVTALVMGVIAGVLAAATLVRLCKKGRSKTKIQEVEEEESIAHSNAQIT